MSEYGARANLEDSESGAYRVDGYGGIAWRYIGPETETVAGWEDVEDGEPYYVEPEERETGRVKLVMVGDDRVFSFDPDEVHALAEDAYCAECGQIGCTADGRDRG